ncbi:DUF996 domain-containing protein [Coprothermobacteraceae bacterium]|nr:DUF996 domain-containing protein [Coprothermobacteraceae bacterium]
MRERLNNARLLGGIGALLMVATLVPLAGKLASTVAWILLAIAVYYISKEYDDRLMFNYLVLAAVLNVVAILVIGGGLLQALISSSTGYTQSMSTLFKGVIGGVLVLLVSAVLFLTAFLRIAGYTGRPIIKVGAWMAFVGSILPLPFMNSAIQVAGWVCIGVGFLTWEPSYTAQ